MTGSGPGCIVSCPQPQQNGLLIVHDGSVSAAGVSVPPGWSNWNPVAVPGPENGLDCMQFLSGTALGQYIYCVTEVQSKCVLHMSPDGSWMTFECANNFIQVHPLCMLPN